MSSTRHSRLPQPLRKLIDAYRRRWRAIHAETGVLVTFGVLGASIGAAVAADRLLRLSPALRAIALGVIAVAAAFCLARWVLWPALRRMRDRDAAARLGHHYPTVEEDLVSAVELSADDLNEQGISHGLVDSALRQIVGRSKGVDYKRAVPVRPMLKVGGVVAAILIVLLAAYQLRREAVQNALARLFRPAAEVPFFSYTKLAVAPGDRVVRVGDSVEIVATTTGQRASVARLYARKGDGAEPADRIFARLSCAAGVGRWQSGPLFEDLAYRLSAGDAVSEWYRVRVVPPPSLAGKGAVLTLPDYAGSRTVSVAKLEGPLQVVRGTQVVVRVQPAARGDDPKLACTGEMELDGETVALTPDASGALVSRPIKPEKTAECAITLTDGHGLRNRTPESLFIKVVPDRVPVVSIGRPGRDLLALAEDVIKVEATATDEFGIRGLLLRYRAIKREGDDEASERWQKLELKAGGADVGELTAETTLNLQQLGIVPGDVLEYKAEASDYADDALFRRGASPVYRVTVLTEMEHLVRVLGRLKELELELLRRAATQNAQSSQAGNLAKAAGEGEDVRDPARNAADRELDEARATEHLARKLENLIPDLARNPATPTDMLTEMERLGRGTRSVAREQMREAAEALAQASQGQQGQPQEGQPQEGQPGQPGQPPPQMMAPFHRAEREAREAARRLEQLARLADRLQRQTLLEKLAAQAEVLAARQRGLKDNLVPIARHTIGTDPANLPKAVRRSLDRIVTAQRQIKDDTVALTKEIELAAASLGFTNPNDAETAEEARKKLEEDKTAARAGEIADRLAGNAIFSQIPVQESVAQALLDVADILRRGVGSDLAGMIMKELEEFIARQKEINADIEKAIKEEKEALRPNELGSKQGMLQRDVKEQASALHWLARDIGLFDSKTARKLDAAGKEMGLGSSDLFRRDLPEGLEHGKRALALLEDAREEFQDEMEQMEQAAMNAQMMQALLLLQRCLLGQKRVNTTTKLADRLRLQEHEHFDNMAVALAKNQSKVRSDATRLQKLIAQFQRVAEVVGKSADKMALSRIALGAGDTGKETREVQRQALLLLEALLRDGMGAGAAGARGMAMMGMMGGGGGGYDGGTNAPIMPATTDEAKDEDWRRVRSRFDEQLGAAFEARVPARYRGMLDAYFDRLRKEPVR